MERGKKARAGALCAAQRRVEDCPEARATELREGNVPDGTLPMFGKNGVNLPNIGKKRWRRAGCGLPWASVMNRKKLVRTTE
jgi:hypothetical protein